MVSLFIIGIVVFLILSVTLFLNFYPTLGGSQSAERKELFEQSGHYKDGIFVNQIKTTMDMNFSKGMSILKDYINGIPNQSPKNPVPVLPLDSMTIVSKKDSIPRVTWFGHSAFLLEINGKNILLDPMFGEAAAPHSWLGPSRFSDGLPIEIEKLPKIDAVVFSHDHYDHLDYDSIIKLKNKVDHFYTPLGVGAHLLAWGVEESKISELNWWDEVFVDDLHFICAPARHFSGRGLLDRSTTMWASWIIKSKTYSIYFSGDSGYGPHFKEIGEKHGPFDFAMMECGQYDKRWENIHMLPEQTAQAALELNTKLMMPIHWGSFVLALHSWTDPVERVTKKAQELGVEVITPKIGEQFNLNETKIEDNNWWVKWH
ncbi:MAG: MBL fold metallo-hydrolase [Calditrichaeota bacterium]|nr:MAG: MBL fold metallo-hydrolase [Calditrichota bacterium]MBL1207343.1 MBL fold metallo-hydrolase [Calditrichota bacterium]NOG47176.1 MBL fold metallo-hydrolase [Calditrichota bacterium]